MRPPEARQKPKVSAFINAKFDKIEALAAGPRARLLRSAGRSRRRARPPRPDRRHVQPAQRRRDPADDPDARRPGRLSDARPKRWPIGFDAGLDEIRASAARFPRRLRVFFEEWDDPLISGIRWVEELVEIAGGEPIFPGAGRAAASRRIASSIRRKSRGAIRRSSSRRGAGRR